MSDGKITVGNVQITGLTDAEIDMPVTLDQLWPTVPRDAWAPFRQRYPEAFGGPNVWHNHFGCYLLRSQGQTILVDTGVGPANSPWSTYYRRAGRLMERLQDEGVRPEDIETVVLTHLHPDHVGWNVLEEGGQRRLTFPRARYIVHQADWEAFQTPEVKASRPYPFVDEVITPLQTLGALELISTDRTLTNELTAIHTPGHTPGHLSILVVSGSERAIIWADAFLHPAQVTEPEWTPTFDMDGRTAEQTRYRLLERIEAEGMTVAACHFPGPGFGRIVRLEGRRYWQAL